LSLIGNEEKIKNMSASEPDSVRSANDRPEWLEIVRRQVASLRYGVVQVVVHDSAVTQIEKTERVRLDKAPAQTKTIWADRKVGA
jgi:hypothetical protein